MNFQGKTIVVGVCGGIAAYKSVELVRLLKRAGADVHVMMTKAARRFVGEITFKVLSENEVVVNLFERSASGVQHIEVAGAADAVVIAPATANMIGKLASGIADDALSTTMMAVTSPVLICPAMNTHMYENPVVQRNLGILKGVGLGVLDPDAGDLACKTTGPGRLPEPAHILDRLEKLLTKKDLEGQTVLVSAGPTQENIDPVRYISNHSSGRMGYAVAAAAEKRGARVMLVSGPVSIDPPLNVDVVNVTTCDEMAEAFLARMADADILIKVAAVVDFKPAAASGIKIKKRDRENTLKVDLEKTTDILALAGEKKRSDQFLCGFAAETDDLEKNACMKLEKKHLDMIVANRIGEAGSGFGYETNKVALFFRDGASEDLPVMTKSDVADRILDAILSRVTGNAGART